jgi:hypothetical protein
LDFARIEIDFDLVTLFYLVWCIGAFQKGQSDIEGISIKDPGKGLGNDT